MRLAIVLVLAMMTCASVAWAASVVVSQQKRSFGVRELRLKAGDEVVFVNDDYYGHNVYSEGAEFDIGLQDPGESRTVTFETAGEYSVRCRIHPRMRLTVVVEE